jgi:phosphoribosylanthranilate isomerase
VSHIWTKICGITNPVDAEVAAQSGADAIGIVFVPQSPRCVGLGQAQEIVSAVKGDLSCVGLFLDAQPSDVSEVLDAVDLDCLQFHGTEPASDCERFGFPFIKGFGAGDVALGRCSKDEWLSDLSAYSSATYWLIDSHRPGAMGGTGQSSDWTSLKPMMAGLSRPWVLAGGLSPSNIVEAITALSPTGVDLSSGVESQPGIKDHGKIRSLMTLIRSQ